MQTERRELRSSEPAEAIRYFLAQNATDAGLRAAVVSHDDGMLLGGIGDAGPMSLANIASLGATMLDVRDASERARLCDARGIAADELHVVRLGIGRRTFVITSIGAPLHAAGRLGAALDRILH